MKQKFVGTVEVAHSDADYLKYELAKILGCDETEEAILNAAKSLRAVAKWAEKVDEQNSICLGENA